MKKHISTIIAILVFITGLSLLLYPTVSNYWNSKHQTAVVANYSDTLAKMDDKDKLEWVYESDDMEDEWPF